MKTKRFLSLFIALVLCLSSFTVLAADESNDEKSNGELSVFYNGEIINFDVEPIIENGRTLVPLRAISEAFECEVHWYDDSRAISIYSPAEAFVVSAERLTETITDDEGNVLIEAVAYYPALENPAEIPFLDEINSDYKQDAKKFIEEAKAKKDDTIYLINK